jgi:hypothetical protein
MLTKTPSFKAGFLRLAKASKGLKLIAGGLALATLVLPAVLSSYNYSALQLLLAMVLLDVCLYPTFRYLLRKEGLPILPLLCLAFAVQYAIPIFTQEPAVQVTDGFRYLDDRDILAALVLTIIGVVALQIAYYALNYRKTVTLVPRVKLSLNVRRAEIFCFSVFLLSLFLNRVHSVLSEETFLQFSSVITLLQNQIIVAIGILGWLAFTERGNRWHKILLYVVVAVAAAKGFASTMMETMMAPLAVLFMSKWFYTRRLPLSMLVLISALFLFLSPVKKDIRMSNVLAGNLTAAEVSTTDRATDWISQSLSYWSEAFSGRRDFAETSSDAASRTDLIHSFAHIHSLTPSVVPYQYGDTYSYLAIAWIPRMIWPEKPTAKGANDFFAIAYNVSTEEGVKTSTFGITLMGEGYINFGIGGVILVMAFLGLVTSLLEDIFAGSESGPGGRAIFLAAFVYFLNGIGSSAEQMFGSILQNLVCGYILLLWAREKGQALTKFIPAGTPSVRLGGSTAVGVGGLRINR